MKYLLSIFFAFSLMASEEKAFEGTIKLRLQEDYTYSFYIKLNDGTKVSISSKNHDVDLRKYIENQVEINGVIRPKAEEQPNDFIRRVTQAIVLKKQSKRIAEPANVVTNI